jgi:hypothetical protein
LARERRLLLAAALLVWGALAAAFVLRLDGRAQDDHYITYRYALNLARGEGLVYNPGERVFGLSEPGLALLLAGLHAVAGADIPRASTFLFAAALALVAALLLEETRRRSRSNPSDDPVRVGAELASARGQASCPPTLESRRGRAALGALLGGTLWLGSSAVWTNHGSAGAGALALLVLAARLAGARPGVAGLLAGAAAGLRPDALAGAGLLGLLLAAESRRVPRRYALAAGGVVIAGLLAAWVWFGTPLPETVAAKRADALAGAGGAWDAALAFWQRAAALAPRHFGATWRALFLVGLVGLVPLWRGGGRAARLLVLYAAAVALAYTVLGVPFFSWYLLPVLAALLYGVGFAVAEVGCWVGERLAALGRVSGSAGGQEAFTSGGDQLRPGSRGRAAAGVLLALLAAAPLLLPFALASWQWQRSFAWYGHLDTYRRAAVWLRRETPPDAAVAYVEIGVLGYASGRRMVDLMGLVTREARPYLAARDVAGAFRAAPAEIVVFHTRGRLRPLVARRWFQRAFAPVAQFHDRQGAGGLTIYRRRPGSWLPPPRPPRLP